MSCNKFYISIFVIWAVFSFSAIGCINIPIGNKPAERSNSIRVAAPPAPYEKSSSRLIDLGWIHQKTGATISYLSECSETDDVSLQQMQLTALSGIRNLKILEEKEITFEERRAIRSHSAGDVDGVAINIDLLLVKKNGCRYTFTLTGFPQTYSQGLNDFNRFLSGVDIR